jgi:formate--tetrahydrofolate ligase
VSTNTRDIRSVADALGIPEELLQTYGNDKAKVSLDYLERPRAREKQSRLILVSAITPTKAGEGKTTTTIGLGDAMAHQGENVCIALREPSLGPCFGIKGGGTGGGRCQVSPAAEINLHFTGDFHAISSAHNLLAAMIDNHVHFRSDLDIDARRVAWKRVVDMNDRALRDVVLGLGGPGSGMPREGGFDITAASEIMAILCLATGPDDLRERIERTLVGYRRDRSPVFARDIGCTGAMLALLKDAMKPNLAQTLEGTPAFVHGGPFANIAHGCNSVLATKMALHSADWVITEAGFGFDLGAEKFFDIKCRSAGLDTAAVVLVASARALAMHGDGDVGRGMPNLEKHIESIRHLKRTPIVALNRFEGDTDAEIDLVRKFCAVQGVPFAVADHFARGPEGAADLAKLVVEHADKEPTPFHPIYELDEPMPDKIRKVAQTIYGAESVVYTKAAARALKRVEKLGYSRLPICIAKTQSSLSDDPKLRGRPTDFEITVRGLEIAAGAGFVVVLTGDILRMPGLPREPAAGAIDLVDGEITGLS